MHLNKLFIIFALILPALAEDRVSIHNGRVKLIGYESCNITNEGKTVEVRNNVTTGFMFGLVYYQCGDNFGYLISKMDCFECGIYCIKNDYIENCQNVILQRTIGAVTGMVFSAVLGLILYLGLGKILAEFWYYIIAWRQSRSDHQANKVADAIERSTMITATPAYKDKHNIIKRHGKAYKNRKDVPTGIYGLKNMSAKPNSDIEMDIINEVSDKATSTNNPRRSSVTSTSSYMTKAFLGMTIISVIMTGVSSCDMNFYFKTNGNICNENNCFDINMYTFVVSYGKVICFTGQNGKITKFKIESAIERIRYQWLYTTSNATITSETNWKCEGKEDCDKDSCTINKKHQSFTKWNGLNGYSCETTSSPCDTYCFYGGHCVYYHWNIKPLGAKYNIYGYVSKIWELEVVMLSHETVTKAIMNVNNPSVNMEIKNIESSVTIPMYVTGVDYEEDTLGRNGVLVGNNMYDIITSEKNLPVGGSIGDFQVSVDDRTLSIDETMVKCQVDNCKGKCTLQMPAISKIIGSIDKYRSTKVSKVMSKRHVVETTRKIRPTLSLGVGNVDFKSLYVKPTLCKLSAAMTFGCVACNTKPYVVFEAMDVKSEGIVLFDSNCTFSRKYLSCSSVPYQLELEENYKTCMMYIPTFNQTIYINVDYQFQGELSPMRTIVGKETFAAIAASIVTSKPFYETIFHTLAGCAMISTAITVVVKIAKLYAITKIQKEVEGVTA